MGHREQRAEEELRCWQDAVWCSVLLHLEGGVDTGEQWGQVVRRVVQAAVATDGAAVAHLPVDQATGDGSERRKVLQDERVVRQFGIGDSGADAQCALDSLDGAELRQPVDVDERLGGDQVQLQRVDQTLSAGQRGRTVDGGQEGQRLG